MGERLFGEIPELPTFRADDSVGEAASRISSAKFKMDRFMDSLTLIYQPKPVQVCQPPQLPVFGSSGGSSLSGGALGGGSSSAAWHVGGGGERPPGDDDDDDSDGPSGWGLGDNGRKEHKEKKEKKRET